MVLAAATSSKCTAGHLDTRMGHQPAALIILNQPLCAMRWLERMWMATSLHLCADGGANRLYDLCGNDRNP
ncbi:hypothetical protein BC829DRAFT_394890 [Chytridium lagenaria]|nr:hypothetical protein BC829DRAFT_394890 [Chytridium lagenaria]